MAQYQIGFRADEGTSKIYSSWKPNGIPAKYYFAPSANVGLFYCTDLGKRMLLGMELMVFQAEGKDKSELGTHSYQDSSGKTGYFNIYYSTERHFTYLSVPVYLGIKVRKLCVLMGIQACYALRTAFHARSKYVEDGRDRNWEASWTEPARQSVNEYNLGLYEGLQYQVNERLGISANFYLGVNRILIYRDYALYPFYFSLYPYVFRHWQPWKITQLTLGVRYSIFAKG